MTKKANQELKTYNGAPPSPGVLLRAAREKMRVTQGDVANELNLSVNIILAIEDDCYDELPGAAFSRGYLRSYAHLVAVDEAAITSSREYINMAAGRTTSVAARLNHGRLRQSSTNGSWYAVMFLVFLAIGVSIWLLLHKQAQNGDASLSQQNPGTEIQIEKPAS
ncbi:MAG: helix-turn-helix domain-containing protein [Arenicellales bacterium WSBS_2016_MAG_OTU3]